MKTSKHILLIVALLLGNLSLQAQTEPVYVLREYMKVEPGQYDKYLQVEQVWKKVHQRRVDEGKILGWGVYRSAFYGTNAHHDFMVVTRFRSGKDLAEAQKMTWDYIKKGISAQDTLVAFNSEKTRKMVSSMLSEMRLELNSGRENHFFKMTHLKVMPGKWRELEALETLMKPVFGEAAKMGPVSAWRFGKHLFPLADGGATYYRIINTTTMDEMLKVEEGSYLETAFKKVYPAKDFAATMKSIRDLITIMDVELYEFVDGTK